MKSLYADDLILHKYAFKDHFTRTLGVTLAMQRYGQQNLNMWNMNIFLNNLEADLSYLGFQIGNQMHTFIHSCGSISLLMPDMPPENLVAKYDAVNEFNNKLKQ